MQRAEEVELRVVLSEEQRQNLRAALIKDSDVVTNMLVRIDVEEAKAMVPEDHEQLSVRSSALFTAIYTC